MSHQTEVDVFISGCGPVGLFAAINLVRYGMTVRIVEQLLINELAAYGVLVERPVELVDFVVDGEGGVLSSLKDLNTGSISFVRSKYLLGCDGSHSFIRKRLGIPMEGDTTETLYGRIDGIIKTNLPRPDELCRIQGEMGSASAVPIDSGYTRVGFTVKTADSDDPINRHNVTLDMLLERAIQSFKPFELEFEEVVWWTVYQVSQRIAEKFSAHNNRVFICGDACHTHSSIGAQGLNIGFMDAHNIAWKIFWRERKGAQPILLDTYQEERRFVAERVIELDRKQTSLSVGRGPQGSSPGLNSNVEKEINYIITKNWSFSTGLGIEYEPNFLNALDLTQTDLLADANIPRPGQRAPDSWVVQCTTGSETRLFSEMPHVGCFYLLVFAGDLDTNASKMRDFAEHLKSESSFMSKYNKEEKRDDTKFRVLVITTTTRDKAATSPVSSLSEEARSVYSDSAKGEVGWCHRRYGVKVQEATIVVVRPDGWVGFRDKIQNYYGVDDYFAAFLC